MRVMVFVKASKESETGQMPSEKILTDMGKFNEELVNAGVMLAGEGLHPSSKGKRVRFSGANRTVIDGPAFEPFPHPRHQPVLLHQPDDTLPAHALLVLDQILVNTRAKAKARGTAQGDGNGAHRPREHAPVSSLGALATQLG